MNRISKKIVLFCLIMIFALFSFAACSKGEGVAVSSADALMKKLSKSSSVKINVSKDIVLDDTIVINGKKEIVGSGTISATFEGSEDKYMFSVSDGGKLTIGGSVTIDASEKVGAVHVQEGGSAKVQKKAVIKNASEESANVLVEGNLEIAGGSLKDAKGHNIHNKKETLITGGEIIGSGEKYAGVYNEGSLTQKGGTIAEAYHNISNVKGANFAFEGGANTSSVKDGVFVAEGATMTATNKEAFIEEAGARGILLHGQAEIKAITVQACGDTLIKVGTKGTLNLAGGILQEGNYHGVDNAGSMTMSGGIIQSNTNCGIVNTGILKVTSGSISKNLNKGILNKHTGTADVTSEKVNFTSNKIAIGNTDKATFEFAKAKIMMSTMTNVYCYDGTINISDIVLNASTSNNVRVVNGIINMKAVEVKGNSATSGTSQHGIYLEGGKIDAEDVTINNTSGCGIRNKGGVFNGKNIVMHDINAMGISQGKHDYLDVESSLTIDGLKTEKVIGNNVNADAGKVTISDAVLGQITGVNHNVKVTGTGLFVFNNVKVNGTSGKNKHGVMVEGGDCKFTNVTVDGVPTGNGIYSNVDTSVVEGTNITVKNCKNGIVANNNSNMVLTGLSVSKIEINNIQTNGGNVLVNAYKNGKNAVLDLAGAHNVKANKGTIALHGVDVKGTSSETHHGIMAEGGDFILANVNVTGVPLGEGIYANKEESSVKGTNVTITGCNDGIKANNNSSIVISGLTTSEIKTNNIITYGGNVTVSAYENGDNSVLGIAGGHNTKSTSGTITLNGVDVKGTSSKTHHGIMAEGGNYVLNKVTVEGVPVGEGIYANKKESVVKGTNVTITGCNDAIKANNNSNIEIAGLTTSEIATNNIITYGGNVTVKAYKNGDNSVLGIAGEHNVKSCSGTITLNDVSVKGTKSSKHHGIMAEGGNCVLNNVKIEGVPTGNGIYTNVKESVVTGTNIMITGCTNAVQGNNGGTIVITGLATSEISNNNVLTHGGNVTVNAYADGKNAILSKSSGHNAKAASGTIALNGVEVQGAADGKYGIIAEGGDFVLNEVDISNVTKTDYAAIRINTAASKIEGTDVTVDNSYNAIAAFAGTVDIDGFTTTAVKNKNIYLEDNSTAQVTVANGTLCGTAGNNVHAKGAESKVTLKEVTIESTSGHAIMAEGGDFVLKNVTVEGASGKQGIYANKETSSVKGTNITVQNCNNAVQANNNSKIVIDGLTTSGINNNNILTNGGNVTVNAYDKDNKSVLGIVTSGDNIVGNIGSITLNNVEVQGCTTNDKYGIFVGNADGVITGKNVKISGSSYGIGGSAGAITIDGLTTENIRSKNVLLDNNNKYNSTASVAISNGTFCGTTGNSFHAKGTDNKCKVSLTKVTIAPCTAHVIMAEGGDFELDTITIQGATPNKQGIYANNANSKVTGKNVTVQNCNNAVQANNSAQITIAGLTTSGIINNNILTHGGNVTVNAYENENSSVLGAVTSGDNIVGNKGSITLNNVEAQGCTTNNKYGIFVGNAAGVITGTNVKISGSSYGIGGSAGTITMNGLTTENIRSKNILLDTESAAKVAINNGSNGSICGTSGNSFHAKGTDSKITLNNVTIAPCTAHVIMAEGGDVELDTVTIQGATPNKQGIYANNANSKVTGKNVTVQNCTNAVQANNSAQITLAGLTTSGITNNNILTNGGHVTVNAYENGNRSVLGIIAQNSSDKVYDGSNVVGNKGSITLNNVDVQGCTTSGKYGIYAGDKDGVITGTNLTVTGSSNGVGGKAGTVTITGLTTSGITNNNILSSGANITVNAYKDGKKSVLGIAGGHNAKATAGLITLNGVSVKGTKSIGHHGVIAEGGSFNLTNVDISDVTAKADGAGIRINQPNCYVTGSGVSIKNCQYGVSAASSGRVSLTNVTFEGMLCNNVLGATYNAEEGTVTYN